jgi:hypothetical protein
MPKTVNKERAWTDSKTAISVFFFIFELMRVYHIFLLRAIIRGTTTAAGRAFAKSSRAVRKVYVSE